MKNSKNASSNEWFVFAFYSLAGYLLTIAILGFLPTKDFTYFELASKFLIVSFIPLLMACSVTYCLIGKKIVNAKTIKESVLKGILSASLIAMFTPAFTNAVVRFFPAFKAHAQYTGFSQVLIEGMYYAFGGFVYGLAGALIFGSLLGSTLFKRSRTTT